MEAGRATKVARAAAETLLRPLAVNGSATHCFICLTLMSPDYIPIDCHFYDLLEVAATQRRRVELQYFNDLRQLCLGSGVINTFFIRDKVEFMQLKSGEEIRLDHLIRLDDTPAPLYADYPDFSGGC